MNCKIIQRRLLGAEHPERPSAEIQTHLDGCARCRDWQARLVHVEQNVALLPVPPSTARGAFLQQLTEAAPVCEEPPRLRIVEPSAVYLRRPAAKLTPQQVFGLSMTAAAAVLLFGFVSWSLRQETSAPVVLAEKPKKDVLITSLLQEHLHLASATTKTQRADALDKIARNLDRESQALPPNAQDLINDFSQWAAKISASLEKIDGNRRLREKSQVVRVDDGRVQQLERNRGLIQILVLGAVRMADVEDPLKRADCCQDLVQKLVSEIAVAARQNEGSRANELGENLYNVLSDGVAKNLRVVQRPKGSSFEREIQRVVDWVVDATDPLEVQLADQPAMRVAYLHVLNGRQAVVRVKVS